MSGTDTQTREGEDTSADDTQAQELLADAVEEQQEEDGTETAGDGDGEGGDAKPAGTVKPAEGGKADNKVDRAELNKVIKERQDAKRQLREALKERDDLKRASEGETERAQREAREQAAAEVEGKYKPLVVRTSAEAALIAAGVATGEEDQEERKKKISRVIRLMKLDDIEVTDDGEVDGIDAQITELKEEYPELFVKPEPPRRKTSGAKAADGADKPAPKKKLSAAEQMMRQLRGEK